jgi:aldose 1-epimerase
MTALPAPSHATATAPTRGPNGAGEHTFTAAGYRAVVDEIGATLRVLAHNGRDLVVPYPAGQVRPLYRGAILAPWPNRVVDGSYTFAGRTHQLPLNEPDRGHALHGLVHWVRWAVTVAGPDHVRLEHDLVPQDGYPFPLHLSIDYRIGDQGLTTRLTATNTGDGPAPYGCCPHPYLTAGPGPVGDWTLRLPADLRLEVDSRLAPTGLTPVQPVDCDFRSGTGIGDRRIDHAFTGLHPDTTGRTTITLRAPSGTGVAMSFGRWAPWVQIHTADRPEPQWNRVGLAVEPMSCPPDAFNSGDDLTVLKTGDAHTADWTITALHPGNQA